MGLLAVQSRFIARSQTRVIRLGERISSMAMRQWMVAGLMAVLSIWPAIGRAADAQTLLESFVDGVRTIEARFEQVQYDDNDQVIEQRSGSFVLSRPGRFVWHYQQPYEQWMICDGEQIWNYEPDLDQATVRSAGQVLTDSPAALLAEGANLSERFLVEDGGVAGKAQIVRLKPTRPDADFTEIELWLYADGEPQRIRFHDALGGVSDVLFSEVRTNSQVDSQRFEFEPPAGVDVVRLDDAAS